MKVEIIPAKTRVILDGFDLHLELYAKGHYERSDTVLDLRKIVATLSRKELVYTYVTEVYQVVCNVYCDLLKYSQGSFRVGSFFSDLFAYHRNLEREKGGHEIVQVIDSELRNSYFVIPAKAGIQCFSSQFSRFPSPIRSRTGFSRE